MMIGDGVYTEYKELAMALGIGQSILFTGVLKNPFALLKHADLYALTSKTEGFPNALIEAMACGVPCISANCMTGPNEILADDFTKYADRHAVYETDYGILTGIFTGTKNLNADEITEEEKKFADTVISLLNDKARLDAYRKKAPKRAEDFSMEVYVESIMTLVRQELAGC